jgi:hypothetical protein
MLAWPQLISNRMINVLLAILILTMWTPLDKNTIQMLSLRCNVPAK